MPDASRPVEGSSAIPIPPSPATSNSSFSGLQKALTITALFFPVPIVTGLIILGACIWYNKANLPDTTQKTDQLSQSRLLENPSIDTTRLIQMVHDRFRGLAMTSDAPTIIDYLICKNVDLRTTCGIASLLCPRETDVIQKKCKQKGKPPLSLEEIQTFLESVPLPHRRRNRS